MKTRYTSGANNTFGRFESKPKRNSEKLLGRAAEDQLNACGGVGVALREARSASRR